MNSLGFRRSLDWKEVTFFAFWLAYFLLSWSRAISIADNGSLLAGHVNIWGDWAVHFTMGSSMAYRELVLTTSPLLIDAPFAYPFATNLIPALLVRVGVPFFSAFVICSFVFSMLLIAALYFLYRVVFPRKKLALLAACLFLFNGGIGAYYFLGDVISATEPLNALLNPTHEYTHIESKHIKWISVISSMILPQRAFTMGFGMALFALALIYREFGLLRDFARPIGRHRLVLAGIILGFLPVVHTHSFLACFIILACWFLADLIRIPVNLIKQRLLAWALVFVCTCLVALPLIAIFLWGHVSNQSIKWFPGWYAQEFGINWFTFWFKNWTLVPVLAISAVAMMLGAKSMRSRRLHVFLVCLPGLILFTVPNLALTQPWIWDNTKLLIWASVFFSALAVYAIDQLFSHSGLFARTAMRLYGSHKTEALEEARSIRFVRRGFLGLIISFLLASGIVDAYYTVRVDLHRYTLYNKNELALAEWVKNETPVESVWLTSTKHNHWLSNLTGRQAVITYVAWLWTHGYDYSQIEKDVQTIYSTGDESLLEQYAVDYVVIDQHARREMRANDGLFRERFELVKQIGQHEIFVMPAPD